MTSRYQALKSTDLGVTFPSSLGEEEADGYSSFAVMGWLVESARMVVTVETRSGRRIWKGKKTVDVEEEEE